MAYSKKHSDYSITKPATGRLNQKIHLHQILSTMNLPLLDPKRANGDCRIDSGSVLWHLSKGTNIADHHCWQNSEIANLQALNCPAGDDHGGITGSAADTAPDQEEAECGQDVGLATKDIGGL